MSKAGYLMILIMAAVFMLGCEKSPDGSFNAQATEQASDGVKAVSPTELDLGGGVTMKLVKIPSGSFMMGSPSNESGRYDDEVPQHRVTISRPFYMGVYEVTQAQYEAVMGGNPSSFKQSGRNAPVETVSWDDAMAFCKRLSQKTGKTVTLPTEAQWEYACRAGSQTRFYYGDDLNYSLFGNYAWYTSNSNLRIHPVGGKIPNAWGLYDMYGNAWEWCSDWYDSGYYAKADNIDPKGPQTGSDRVLRGGCWYSGPWDCRSATRGWVTPDYRGHDIGFRVVVSSSPWIE